MKDRQHLFTLHKRAKKAGLDILKYNHLKDQISAVEIDLRRLRDPLYIHLPHHHTLPAKDPKRSDEANSNSTACIEDKLQT